MIFIAAAMSAPTLAVADEHEEELEEAELFFELNDTDGDLGIHGFADGDAWKELKIVGPDERKLLEVDVKSRLKRQGLTEIFFESAEPCFPSNPECDDPLDPQTFFDRFPEGTYEIEVETLEGDELESEVYLSHLIPAAPEVVSVGGDDAEPEEGECWGLISGAVDVMIDWNPVTMSHLELGTPNDAPLGDNEVINYEFVAEIDGTDIKSSTIVSPDTTEWTIPGEFIALAEGVEVEDDGEVEPVSEIKFEILVRVDNGDGNPGNKSAVESCFETDINEEE
jgi:hypothetical protein